MIITFTLVLLSFYIPFEASLLLPSGFYPSSWLLGFQMHWREPKGYSSASWQMATMERPTLFVACVNHAWSLESLMPRNSWFSNTLELKQ